MDDKKILEVINTYRRVFKLMGVGKIDFPHDRILIDSNKAPAHCHGMLDQMEKFLREGRREKVFRWLGFVQGCLWSASIYTLDDLMNHNRPNKK